MKLKNIKHRRAGDGDIDKLLPWLKADYFDFGEGFWPQRAMICRGVAEGDLYMATHRGKVVGFQLGETQVDLIQVQRRHQRKGIGALLLDRVLQRASKASKSYCFAGALDEGFWLKQGFSEFVGSPMGGKTLMALRVPTWSRQSASTAGPQAEQLGLQ